MKSTIEGRLIRKATEETNEVQNVITLWNDYYGIWMSEDNVTYRTIHGQTNKKIKEKY